MASLVATPEGRVNEVRTTWHDVIFYAHVLTEKACRNLKPGTLFCVQKIQEWR
ncbi:hypothetical protein GXP75_00420 [Bacillus sp. HU-1818]|nr:hypothetical protein [Bacillus sp. HU-1818]